MIPSELIGSIDARIIDIAETTFNGLGEFAFDILRIILLIYVLFVAITFLLGRGRALSQVSWDMVLISIFLSVGTVWTFLTFEVYNVLTNFPDEVATTLLGGLTAAEILDEFLVGGVQALSAKLGELPLSNFGTYLAFVLLAILPLMVLGIVATFIFILAKVAVVTLFGLLPLFTLFAVFNTTRDFFIAYVRQLLNYMIVPLLLAVLLRLAYALYLEATVSLYTETASIPLAIETGFIFGVLIGLVLLAPYTSSAIAGGFAVGTMGVGAWAVGQAQHGYKQLTYKAKNIGGLLASRSDGTNRLTRSAEGRLRFTRFLKKV